MIRHWFIRSIPSACIAFESNMRTSFVHSQIYLFELSGHSSIENLDFPPSYQTISFPIRYQRQEHFCSSIHVENKRFNSNENNRRTYNVQGKAAAQLKQRSLDQALDTLWRTRLLIDPMSIPHGIYIKKGKWLTSLNYWTFSFSSVSICCHHLRVQYTLPLKTVALSFHMHKIQYLFMRASNFIEMSNSSSGKT